MDLPASETFLLLTMGSRRSGLMGVCATVLRYKLWCQPQIIYAKICFMNPKCFRF